MKNNSKLHIFYIGSYLHLLVADSIIRSKTISLKDVWFITYRGITLPSQYSNNLLFDEAKISKKQFFLKNYFKLRTKLNNSVTCAYMPFQQEFPVLNFFDEYIFFEEGLSAYDISLNYSVFNRSLYLKRLLNACIKSIIFNKKILGLYYGRNYGSPFSIDCTLVGLTSTAYSHTIISNCKYEVVKIAEKPLKTSYIKDSFIIIMDSTHAVDRMESADNYLKILSDTLKCQNIGQRKVYLKLHPDNYKDKHEAVELIQSYIGFLNFEIIDESLEDIAMNNQNNIFYGNNSTILFYAPILGKTNKSISFARINAERDSSYMHYIKRWGGLEGLLSLLKQQMVCL